MKILFNRATGVVAGYTDYPEEFAGMPDFVVCDIPQGWDESFRDTVDFVGGVIVMNPTLVLSRNKTQRKADLAALRYQHETAGIVINGVNDMAVKPGVDYQSVAGYVQACFTREKELSAALDAATTLEELNSIDLASGWPA